MEEVFLPIAIVAILFLGLPGMIGYFILQSKRARGLSIEDESLLDEMHDISRRLDERLQSVERILAAENPKWREATLPSRNELSKDIDHVRSSH